MTIDAVAFVFTALYVALLYLGITQKHRYLVWGSIIPLVYVGMAVGEWLAWLDIVAVAGLSVIIGYER